MIAIANIQIWSLYETKSYIHRVNVFCMTLPISSYKHTHTDSVNQPLIVC